MVVEALNRIVVPRRDISMAPAPTSVPSGALAVAIACASSAREGLAPTRHKPMRPGQSYSVDCTPGATTSTATAVGVGPSSKAAVYASAANEALATAASRRSTLNVTPRTTVDQRASANVARAAARWGRF